MIVIADTSPLCYLILIDCIEILPQLYGQVFIPNAVYQELQASAAPEVVKNWIKNYPNWLAIKQINTKADSELEKLDLGEREAIILAEYYQADLVILDDKMGRQIAVNRGLAIIGLLGILYQAAQASLIDLSGKFTELQKTSFFVSPKLLEYLLKQMNNN